MNIIKGWVTGLVVAAFWTAAFAADPPTPAAAPAAASAIAPVDPETADAATALARARELRKLADAGDGDAAFEFARLQAYFGNFGPRADREHAKEWSELRGPYPVSYWLNRAAELGSQQGIESVCRMGNDPLAPADLREKGKARCDELRSRFPAK
jgi:hypothetical protein